MNDLSHQWKWDFRRIRALWINWLVVLVAGPAVSLLGTRSGGPGPDLGSLSALTRYVVVYLFGIVLVARIMSTTPFSGTKAFWKTRPLQHRSLFWGKSLMIVVLIFLPVLLAQLAVWSGQNLGGTFLFWASLQYSALALALFFLAAVWSALCRHFGTFWLCLAGTGAVLAIFAIFYNLLSERFESLPLLGSAGTRTATNSASTSLTMAAVLLIGSAAAWFFGIRVRDRRTALLSLLAGVSVAAGANRVWRTDFLRPLAQNELPERTLEVAVLERDEAPGDRRQLLWAQIAVELADDEMAHPVSWHASIEKSDGSTAQESRSLDWQTYSAANGIQRRLHSFYPEATKMLDSQRTTTSVISTSGTIGSPSRLRGEADLIIYQWRLAASLRLNSRQAVRATDGGLFGIKDVRGNTISLSSIAAPPPFHGGPELLDGSFLGSSSKLSPVVYHEASETAIALRSGGRGFSAAGTFAPRVGTSSLNLESSRWHRMTGLNSLDEEPDALRLDLFEAIPVARATVTWDRKDWGLYFSRELPLPELPVVPKPSIARVPLPENPSAEEVEAHLDGVLFSITDDMSREDYLKTQGDLRALRGEQVERLLARFPVGSHAESMVYRALPALVTEDHQAAVLDALARDIGLVGLIQKKGWQSEAAPVLAKRLASRRPLDWRSSPLALQIVAAEADPTTYEDLRWHFMRSRSGIREVAAALARCPGFPLEECLAGMWAEERYQPGSRREQLAPLAARLGDKEALRLAFINYASDQGKHDLALLAEAVDHPGGDSLPGWIHANFANLTFNEDSRKFELN